MANYDFIADDDGDGLYPPDEAHCWCGAWDEGESCDACGQACCTVCMLVFEGVCRYDWEAHHMEAQVNRLGVAHARQHMETSITLKELRDLVGLRCDPEISSAEVRRIRERLHILASMPRGQELSTALPLDLWAEVEVMTQLFEQFGDVIEGLRLFKLLRPHVNLWQEFVEGD
jgi:hypothetical protein